MLRDITQNAIYVLIKLNCIIQWRKILTFQEKLILSGWHSGTDGRIHVLETSDVHWIDAEFVNPSHASTDVKWREEQINKLQIVVTLHTKKHTLTHTFYILGFDFQQFLQAELQVCTFRCCDVIFISDINFINTSDKLHSVPMHIFLKYVKYRTFILNETPNVCFNSEFYIIHCLKVFYCHLSFQSHESARVHAQPQHSIRTVRWRDTHNQQTNSSNTPSATKSFCPPGAGEFRFVHSVLPLLNSVEVGGTRGAVGLW
jgi:hypothetical protein